MERSQQDPLNSPGGSPMISDAQLTPVLPVVDVNRAAGFYRDRLGLKDAGDDPAGNHLVQTGSGTLIALMPAEEGAQSAHTVLTFEVEDITNEICLLYTSPSPRD